MKWTLPLKAAIVCVAVTLVAAACVEDASSPTQPAQPMTDTPVGATGLEELAYGLQRCGQADEWLEADPSFYRDEPIYVGNEQPIDEVRSWAIAQPGYEDIWIDRDHNGWIAVGFSGGAAERQVELEAEFPGVGVVAVSVPATRAELASLRAEVEAALQGLSSWASSSSVPRAMVEITVPVLDEETLARLAPFAGPTLCVDGIDPEDAVPDRAQPSGGEGWRLLGNDLTGDIYRTAVATTPQQYEEVWTAAGLGGSLPEVDFQSEVVIWFGAVFGSSCPIRMDSVVFDVDRQIVHAELVRPGNPTACTDDANAAAYVVAVERERLPEAPFAVQLSADDPPAGVPEERTTVEVDLRTEGAVAAPAGSCCRKSCRGSPIGAAIHTRLRHRRRISVDATH